MSMTKLEAIDAMNRGHKVTHRFFTSNEWMSVTVMGNIQFEDGVICEPEEFWHNRNKGWEQGYSIIQEQSDA